MAFSSLVHAVGFTLLLQVPVLPRLAAGPPEAVQVLLVAEPPATAAATPEAVVTAPQPPPQPKPTQGPVAKPRPATVGMPQPQPAPAAPAPVPPPPMAAPETPPSAAPPQASTAVVAPPAGGGPPALAPATTSHPGDDHGTATGPDPDTLRALVRHLEAHRYYPVPARRQGIEGTVRLAFRIQADGRLAAVEVRESSGSRLLDRAAVRTVERASPLPRELAAALAGQELTLPVTFRLVDE